MNRFIVRQQLKVIAMVLGWPAIAMVVIVTLFVVSQPTAVLADTWTWTGNSENIIGGMATDNWDYSLGNFNNWSHQAVNSGSFYPVSSADTAIAFSAAESNTSNQDVANPFTLNSLTFNSGSSPVTMSGGTLNFVNSSANVAPTVTQNSVSNQSIAEDITLGNDTTFSVAANSQLTVSSIISGAGAIVKSGPGSLNLQGSNSFSGLTLSGGTVGMNNNFAVSGDMTLKAGQLLANADVKLFSNFSDFSTGSVTFAAATGSELLMVGNAGNGTNGLGITTSANLVFGSPINAGTIAFGPPVAQLFIGLTTGTIAINGGEVDEGTGVLAQMVAALNLSVASGATLNFLGFSSTVLGLTGSGTVQLGTSSSTTMTLNSANFSGVIAGSGQVATSNGVVTLSGANTYTGGTTLAGGALGMGNDAALGPAPITMTASTAIFAANGDHVLSKSITINANQTLIVEDDPNETQAHTLFLAGTIGGSGTLIKTGSGTLTFGGAGTENVNFPASTLIDVEGGKLVGSADFQGNWANNQASLKIAGGATFDAVEGGPAGALQIDALTGSGTFSGGYPGVFNNLATATIGVAGGTGVFLGTIRDNNGAHLAILKAGVGTETFSGTNTYTGGTVIQGGALFIGAAGALPAQGDVLNNATLVVDANSTANIISGLGTTTVATGVTLTVGAFNQGDLLLQIGGTTAAGISKLSVTGELLDNGTLTVSLLSNFQPIQGESFDLLQLANHAGIFPSVQLPTLGGRIVWDGSQLFNTGVLSVVATYYAGDFNRDGQVTVADISAMMQALTDLNTYQATHSLTNAQLMEIGDLDGSGQVTNADLQALIDLLANSGSNGSPTVVPEPTSIVLLGLGALAIALCHIGPRLQRAQRE